MKRLLWGGAGGILATAVMSVLMFASKALGIMRTPPPKEITANAERQVGAPPHRQPPPTFTVTWVLAHTGYGAAFGALYALGEKFLPLPRPLRGGLYGLALWAAGYLGLMPLLGLYPWPGEDNPGRTATMIAAHLAYGESLAWLLPEARHR